MHISNILDKRWYGGLYHLHCTQDTWDQWISEVEPGYDYPNHAEEKILKIFSNNLSYIKEKFVIDLACNLGYLTLAASNLGASKTTGLEIRESYLDTFKRVYEHWPHKNVSLIKANIEDLEDLSKHLIGVDTIIYSGHFYHTSQNESILKLFTQSSAQCIILESINLPKSKDGYVKTTESTLDPLSGYIDDQTATIEIKILTSEKTKSLLEDLGWNIISHTTLESVTPSRFILTATRKNTL